MGKHKNAETGVDWLTMTTTSQRRGDVYFAIFKSYSDRHREPWFFRGYEGVQSANGEVSYGVNKKDARTILIARGAVADDIFITRPPRPSMLSRIDIQTTVVYEYPQYDLLKHIYEFAGGVVSKKTHIVNSDGGETVYVGSRHSQLYVRVYDAGVKHELGKEATIFRYEIEVKKPMAQTLADVLWQQPTVKKMRLSMADWQYQVLEKRAIEPPWEQGVVQARWDSLVQRKTHEDTTFAWLAGQVSAAVQNCLDKGYTRDELCAVLFPPVSPDQEL